MYLCKDLRELIIDYLQIGDIIYLYMLYITSAKKNINFIGKFLDLTLENYIMLIDTMHTNSIIYPYHNIVTAITLKHYVAPILKYWITNYYYETWKTVDKHICSKDDFYKNIKIYDSYVNMLGIEYTFSKIDYLIRLDTKDLYIIMEITDRRDNDKEEYGVYMKCRRLTPKSIIRNIEHLLNYEIYGNSVSEDKMPSLGEGKPGEIYYASVYPYDSDEEDYKFEFMV